MFLLSPARGEEGWGARCTCLRRAPRHREAEGSPVLPAVLILASLPEWASSSFVGTVRPLLGFQLRGGEWSPGARSPAPNQSSQ